MTQESTYETGSVEPMPGRCGGKLRGKQRYCMQYPLKGRKTCRIHNGRAPQGAANPAYKNGRHSQVLSVRVASRYEALVTDPKLLQLSSEIAVADLMMQELLEKLYGDDSGDVESGALWTQLRHLHERFKLAKARNDAATAAVYVDQAWQLIDKGAARTEVRAEMLTVMESRRKLVDSEQKRLRDEQYSMPVEQFLMFVGNIVQVIHELVEDRAVKREFVHRMHGMIGNREVLNVDATEA